MSPAPPGRRRALVALALMLASPAIAAPVAIPLSADDAALVERARAYLSGLHGAKGRFVQTDPRGAISAGTFWLERPGKARFEYDPPSGVVIASDGRRVRMIDRRLKTIQAYPLSVTPLALFLARDIRLDRGVVVTRVTRRAGAFSILARDGRKQAEGRITLDFTDPPVALAGWTLTDPQGGATRVRLLDFAPAGPFPASLFVLTDPKL